MIKCDLHVHTNISDGSLSTVEAISLARNNGVTHMAITNHDTVKGIKKAIEIGKDYGVEIIPGIEISAFDAKRERKVHILGYGFKLEAKNIKNLCNDLLKRRNEMSLDQAVIIKELGYNISIEKIKNYGRSGEVVYKQHIMQELINNGYTDEIYSSLYKKLFKGNGPCKMEIEYIDVYDALDAIINDGGVPVLAHPGQLDSYELLEELVNKGLKGVEKYHCSHSEEDLIKIQNLADKYDLFVTGGSDFHGEYGNEATIGSNIAPQQVISMLL